MATKVTVHTDTRIIELIEPPVNGVASIDLQADVYSPIKDDFELNLPDLRKNRFPFITGVDANAPTTGGRTEPIFFRLRNGVEGWRLQPYDEDHTLFISGTLVPVDASQSLIVPRPGRTILVITDGSEVAGLTQGNALSTLQDQRIRQVWKQDGHDPDNPLTVTPTSRNTPDGDVDQIITGDGDTTSTVTAQ